MLRTSRLPIQLASLMFLLALGFCHCVAVSVVDIGFGARAAALGDAFVGLADDRSCLLYNVAGLAWSKGISFSSTCGTGLDAVSGDLSLVRGSLALGVLYFDFGDVPEVDDQGNVIGSFSYREYLVAIGCGVSATDVAFLSTLPLAESWALGLSLKVLKVVAHESSGLGVSIDIPFLLKLTPPAFGQPFVTDFSFGFCLLNALSLSTTYETGHKESWVPEVTVGASIGIREHTILAAALTSGERFHVGIEWNPHPLLSIRCGLKHLGVWIPSFGAGITARSITLDLVSEIHPFLGNRFRGSLRITWR